MSKIAVLPPAGKSGHDGVANNKKGMRLAERGRRPVPAEHQGKLIGLEDESDKYKNQVERDRERGLAQQVTTAEEAVPVGTYLAYLKKRNRLRNTSSE
ncbi:MAG: hypothetical protein WCG98_01420 [bacterium]